MTSNFVEFRYLDPFEKTLVALIGVFFVISVPEMPILTDQEALKLFFDNSESFSPWLWKFLTVNYCPFVNYPDLFRVAWCTHFYLIGVGFFILTFYSLLRFFVSRRLSLLGVFALVSSWAFSKILAQQYGYAISSTYSLLWVWSTLWVVKSATYRSGLILGFVGYLGSLLNPIYGVLLFVQILLLRWYFFKDKTAWFQRKFFKYTKIGLLLTLFVLLTHGDILDSFKIINMEYFHHWRDIVSHKSFNVLALFGVVILLIKHFTPRSIDLKEFRFNIDKVKDVGILLLILVLFSFVIDGRLARGFDVMWPVVLLSLIPLEMLFQSIRRLRSHRNMIYATYIVICLLDSHIEGRIKILWRIFDLP